MITQAPRQPHLPGLFSRADRSAELSKIPATTGIRAVATGVLDIIRAIDAIEKASPGRKVLGDRRARVAQSVAVCLSLTGQPTRPESFGLLVAMATKAAREQGTRGPAGALIQAAQKLGQALLDPNIKPAKALQSAADAAIRALAHYGATPEQVAQLRAQAERAFLLQLRSGAVH